MYDRTAFLIVDFGADVDRVGFGWAMNCNFGGVVGATLLDSAGGTVTTYSQVAVNTGFPFPENQAYIDPALPFRSMRMHFTSSICTRFFVDNLGYQPLVTPVEVLTFSVD